MKRFKLYAKKRNQILLILLILAIGVVIRYCDIPFLEPLEKWGFVKFCFVKSEGEDMTLYNISISYIVSWIFYLIVNRIPEKIEEEEFFMKRCIMHREIQIFSSDIINLYIDIVRKVCDRDPNIIDKNSVSTIEDLFSNDILGVAIANTNIDDSSYRLIQNQYVLTDKPQYLNWYQLFNEEMPSIIRLGNDILNRYTHEIDSNLFYNIYSLVNESFLISSAQGFMQLAASAGNLNINIEQVIPTNSLQEEYKKIIYLYNWVNDEYNNINRIKGDRDVNIRSIDISRLS